MPLGGLGGDYQAIVHEADAERVNQYRWYAHESRGLIYAIRTVQPYMQMHRFIVSDYEKVDHENGNGLDNRRCNLRDGTKGNWHNRKASAGGSSRFKGVSRHKQSGKWYAAIRIDGSPIHLGSFDSEIAAAGAYDDAAIRYHGEFARTNKMIGLL